jgi:hypothetical protein
LSVGLFKNEDLVSRFCLPLETSLNATYIFRDSQYTELSSYQRLIKICESLPGDRLSVNVGYTLGLGRCYEGIMPPTYFALQVVRATSYEPIL